MAGITKTGEAAREKTTDPPPDPVLMDTHPAGEMDGIGAAGQIHTAYGIPVIFLRLPAKTGRSTESI